jgi:hypothetical protein
MEIKGKVFKIMPLQTGEGKNGTWKKQEFVIEVPGQYPKKVCFCLWGDNIQQFPISPEEEVTVMFDLESREFKERWYTEAKAWRIMKPEATSSDAPSQSMTPAHELKTEDTFSPGPPSPDDDLPF